MLNGESNKKTIYTVSLFLTGRLNSTVNVRDILKLLWTTSDCSRQKHYNFGKRINEIL